MNDIKIHQPDYLFMESSRKAIEEKMNAKFIMDIDPGVGANRALFYTPNPDKSKGHDHYFMIYHTGVHAMITGCRIDRVAGILEDGVFYYSSHRHDHVMTPRGKMIDGGVYYTRSSGETVIMMLEPTGPRIKRNDDVTTDSKDGPRLEGGKPSEETPA